MEPIPAPNNIRWRLTAGTGLLPFIVMLNLHGGDANWSGPNWGFLVRAPIVQVGAEEKKPTIERI